MADKLSNLESICHWRQNYIYELDLIRQHKINDKELQGYREQKCDKCIGYNTSCEYYTLLE